MNHDEEPIDAAVKRLAAEYRESDLRRSESQLAALGECPEPADLDALRRGTIQSAEKRTALARHVIACPRCADRNLTLLASDVEIQQMSNGTRVRRMAIVAAAAAAVVLVTWIALRPGGPPLSPALGQVLLVDAAGREMRDAEPPRVGDNRRALVVVARTGFASLVRLASENGDATIEPVDAAARWAAVTAGEEVLLPLDRAVSISRAETWIVVLADKPLVDDELIGIARAAAAGTPPSRASIGAATLVVRPIAR